MPEDWINAVKQIILEEKRCVVYEMDQNDPSFI